MLYGRQHLGHCYKMCQHQLAIVWLEFAFQKSLHVKLGKLLVGLHFGRFFLCIAINLSEWCTG
jgi:hypothetical protein